MDSIECCYNCSFCNDSNVCTESPIGERGPVSIPNEMLHTYRCRSYSAKYPMEMKKKILKE